MTVVVLGVATAARSPQAGPLVAGRGPDEPSIRTLSAGSPVGLSLRGHSTSGDASGGSEVPSGPGAVEPDLASAPPAPAEPAAAAPAAESAPEPPAAAPPEPAEPAPTPEPAAQPEPAPATAASPSGSVHDAIDAWFPEIYEQALQVAQCESSLDPGAVSAGGGNHGLFQINDVHQTEFEAVTGVAFGAGVYDAWTNSEYARHLYDQSGWVPWACAP